ncbi:MAG: NIF family HAD-type phosphatase [Desulfosporosinus sp.]|nr:NIF family HAD-type phosphatase [Desulfosporosinus sp.]
MGLIIVLDINGVLADVHKKSVAAPKGIKHDLVIPSGQKVYMRPHMIEFCNYLANLVSQNPYSIKVAIWTGRKKVNAEPIERYIAETFGLEMHHYFHGDDCHFFEGCHPIKDIAILRKTMVAPDDHVVFVDDSADRIKLDRNSEAIKAIPFDVGKTDNAELIRIVCILNRIVEKFK